MEDEHDPDLELGVLKKLVDATDQSFSVVEAVSSGPALTPLCNLFGSLGLPIGCTIPRDGYVGVPRLVGLLPFAPVDRPSPRSVRVFEWTL